MEKLEEIDASQRDLVRKPPVLRAFKNQISTFDSRLEHIEGHIKALSASESKTADRLGGVETTVRQAQSLIQHLEASIETLAGAQTDTGSALEAMAAELQAVERTAREGANRSAEMLIAHGKQDSEVQGMLFVLQEGQKQASEAVRGLESRLSALREQIASLQSASKAGDSLVGDLVAEVSHVQANVAALSEAVAAIPDNDARLTELAASLDRIAKEQASFAVEASSAQAALADSTVMALDARFATLEERSSELAAAIGELRDAPRPPAEVEELVAKTAKIEDALEGLAALLAGVRADITSASDRSRQAEERQDSLRVAFEKTVAASREEALGIQKRFDALAEASKTWNKAFEEQIGQIAARIDEREAILSSLQSRAAQPEGMSDGSELVPLIAELRLEIKDVCAEQVKARQALSAVSETVAGLRSQSESDLAILRELVGQPSGQDPSLQLSEYTNVLAESLGRRLDSLDARLEELGATPASETPVEADQGAEEVAEQTEIPSLQLVEPEPAPVAEIPAEEALPLEAEEEPSDGEQGSGEWSALGASGARRWSSMVSSAAFRVAEDQMKPLTPTETPAIDYPVGPMAYGGGRLLFAHGDRLCGFWPGKSSNSVALKKPFPTGNWRLACTDRHAFCVLDGMVEIVSLTGRATHAKFSGDYLDHVCSGGLWVGLFNQEGNLALDFRDKDGKQVAPPLALATDELNHAALAATESAVFVALRSGQIFKVDEGGARRLAPEVEGAELVWLALHNKSLVTLMRVGNDEHLFVLDAKGNVSRQLLLGFDTGVSHPVLMGDKIYLATSDRRLATTNLKKLDAPTFCEIECQTIADFAGIHSGSDHALLLTLLDEGTAGRVALLNPKDGATSTVCRINHTHVNAIAAGSCIALSTGCSYQNMVRVFDFSEASQAKAA